MSKTTNYSVGASVLSAILTSFIYSPIYTFFIKDIKERSVENMIASFLSPLIVCAILTVIIVIAKKLLKIHKNNWSVIYSDSVLLTCLISITGQYSNKVLIEQEAYQETGGFHGAEHTYGMWVSLFFLVITIITALSIVKKNRT